MDPICLVSLSDLTTSQKAELDRRLDAYEIDKNIGRLATVAVADILRKI